MIEYAIMLALITIAVATLGSSVSDPVQSVFSRMSGGLTVEDGDDP